MRTFGVEEELLLVDLDTGVPVALADLVTRPESGDDPPGDPAAAEAAHPASVSVAVGIRDAPVRDGAASKGGPPPATGHAGERRWPGPWSRRRRGNGGWANRHRMSGWRRCTWPSGEPAVPAWRRTSSTPSPAGPLPPGTSSAACCGTSTTPSRRQTPKRAGAA